MNRFTRTLLRACLALSLAGCVERRFLIESDPPGAFVYQNGQFLGATPVDVPFTYYGKYDFLLVKDGFESMNASTRVSPPWYERPAVDFLSENLWPFHIQDVRPVLYQMQPMAQTNTVELMNQARELRERGKAVPSTPAPSDY
ncbi:MAG TPA: PEGA domain-containing protein [Gemmataceae bacterium]|jgi:hypothetical protein|nr:PEGA domain-containing protein [Gemmataceae bacterium]